MIMKSKSSICFCLFALILWNFSCKNTSQDHGKNQRVVTANTKLLIDSLLYAFVDNGDVAGISALVYENEEETYFNAFGYADRENDVPMSRNTIVQIYSMTKPIVSVLALLLMEQGKLRLYDMLPQFDRRFAQLRVLTHEGSILPAERPVMVEDLLTHRAGFTYDCAVLKFVDAFASFLGELLWLV